MTGESRQRSLRARGARARQQPIVVQSRIGRLQPVVPKHALLENFSPADGSAFHRLLFECIHHLAYGRDAADRLLGKLKRKGHSSEEFPVNENRTSTHALEDPGFFQRPPAQARQYGIRARSDAPEHAEYFYLKLLGLAPLVTGS